MSTVADVITDVDLAGLDLTESEKITLIDEAHKELCVESEWTRANLNLGPTVADQAAYAVPASLYRILDLRVGTTPYEPIDEETVIEIQNGSRSLLSDGAWWLSFDSSGTESVSLQPVPSAGTAITARCVVYPDTLDETTDSLRTPESFDRAYANYVKAMALADEEDDEGRRDYYLGEFERYKEKLRLLRHSRAHRKGVNVRIVGVNY